MLSSKRVLAVIPAAMVPPTVLGLQAVQASDPITGLASGGLIGLAILGLMRMRVRPA